MRDTLIEIRHPDARLDLPLSSAVLVDGWLFVSGQGPLDLRTGAVLAGSIEEETERTIDHLERIVREAGGTLADVVKCTCHLSDLRDYAGFNAAYGRRFTGLRPARTTVQSVLLRGIKVEIDAVARIGSRQ